MSSDATIATTGRIARGGDPEAYAVELEAQAETWEAYALEREAGGMPFLRPFPLGPAILQDLLASVQAAQKVCKSVQQGALEPDQRIWVQEVSDDLGKDVTKVQSAIDGLKPGSDTEKKK